MLDTIAIADCALEIHANDLDDLFANAARALADVMVDPDTVSRDVGRTLSLEARALVYRDLGEVVDMVHRLDISRKIASLRPIGNIKG